MDAIVRLPRSKVAGEMTIRVAGLSKRYQDQRALSHVSFDIHEGEVLGLIGPNGAGKTTLLEALAGVLPIDAGDVLCRGETLPLAKRRDVVFYLPDSLRPWDDQYVGRLLEFFGGVYGKNEAQVSEAVQAVGLVAVLGKRVLALSKGYGRRLMLALALLTPHPLLLMDEPFDGFDLRQTREVATLLRHLAANGRTLMLAIHQLTDAERVCDRFVLLAGGTIRGAGTLEELRTEAKRPHGSLEEVFLALT
jgi:ABC-type multidrug transport system ATPase subunit